MQQWETIIKEYVKKENVKLDDNIDKHTLNCVISSYNDKFDIDADNLAIILTSAYNANYTLVRGKADIYGLVYTFQDSKLVFILTDYNGSVMKCIAYHKGNKINNFARILFEYNETSEFNLDADSDIELYVPKKNDYTKYFEDKKVFFETLISEMTK